MKTLNVNDKLLAILSDEPLPTPPPTTDAPSSSSAAPSSDTADLLLTDTTTTASAAPANSVEFDIAAAAAASDPFAGSNDLLEPEPLKPAAPLRAPSGGVGGGGGRMPAPNVPPPVRAPSGGADIFSTLPPPPAPAAQPGLGKTKSEDLFDDFVGMRKEG